MADAHAHPTVHAIAADAAPLVVPSSPTLTNPEMILPCHDSNQEPSPIHVKSSTLKHAELPPLPTSMSVYEGHPSRRESEVGVAKIEAMPPGFKAAPPSSAQIYRYYEQGAPLSDIGEEETTPRSKKTRSRTSSLGQPSSPTIPAQLTSRPIYRLARGLSDRSESSVSASSDLERWEDFDTSNISSERLKADLANARDDVSLDGLDSKQDNAVAIGEDDDEWSSAALSRRAERILADAKKRLTNMEGNLTKARTTILTTPRCSPILGEHQEVGALYRSISQVGDRRFCGHFRRSKLPNSFSKGAGTGHLRVSSETTPAPNPAMYSGPSEPRSASALDYSPGHTMDSMPIGRSFFNSPGSRILNFSKSSSNPLRVLEEEEGSLSRSTSFADTTPRGLGITNSEEVGDYIGRPSNELADDQRRSSSQTSIRSTQELRDHMNGLKNKITDLKIRQKGESLKRRSLQNLRTPSPFRTFPEQWYAGAAEYQEGQSPLTTNAGRGWSPQKDETPEFGPPQSPRSPASPKDSAFGEIQDIPPADGADLVAERGTNSNRPSPSRRRLDDEYEPRDSALPFQGSNYQDGYERRTDESENSVATSEEEQVFLNEVLEESLHYTEPEVSADGELILATEPERHEDRADAFDYENFFLHSALGNYSQPGFNRRHVSRSTSKSADSFESADSVDTAKAGPLTTAERDAEAEKRDDIGGEVASKQNYDMAKRTTVVRHEQAARNDAQGKDDVIVLEDPPTPKALAPPRAPFMRSDRDRSNSVDSISTMATFATATEGGHDSEADSDTVPSEIMYWRGQPITSASPTFEQSWSRQRRIDPRMEDQRHKPFSRSSPPSGTAQYTSFAQHASLRPQSGLPTPPSHSPKDASHTDNKQELAQHSANTEVLMASLITLADPDIESTGPFAERDKDLVIMLLRSVGAVCSSILQNDQAGEVYGSRVWRRRLDAARRVLNGEIEIDRE